MTEREQIEEMAYEMTQYKGKMCERIERNDCLLKFHTNAFINCNYCKLAEHLITEKGYRKQIEGEWEFIEVQAWVGAIYECTNCKARYNDRYNFETLGFAYCPNCGAKMKGERK